MANLTSYTHNLQTIDTDVWEDRMIDSRIDEPHPPSDEDIDISTEDAAFRDQISLDTFPLPCLPAAA